MFDVDQLAQIAIKHLRGQHPQKRHGWRYGGVEDARRAMGTTRMWHGTEMARNIAARERALYRSRMALRNPEWQPTRLKINSSDAQFIKGLLKMERGDTVTGVLNEMFAYKDEATGMHTELTEIKRPRGVAIDNIEIFGRVVDKNGNLAGHLFRVLYRDPDGRVHMHHDVFSLYDKYQNSGFGMAYYRNVEEIYKRRGVQIISLEANLEVGGYAWARAGYSASPFIINKFRTQAAEMWASEARRHKSRVAMPHFDTMYQLAAMKAPWDSGEHFGRRFLLYDRQSERTGKWFSRLWSGSKLLDDNDLGYQAGQLYFAIKDKKKGAHG